jgi:hypothetical protein
LGDLEEEGFSEGDLAGLNGIDGGEGLEDLEAYNFEDDNDVKRLIRAWMRERGTRDIMDWEGDLVDTVLNKVDQQVSKHGHVHQTWSAKRVSWYYRGEC